jgi:PhnB protein
VKSFNPYLNFDGNAGEAMSFYAKALGAELSMQTFADVGMAKPGSENRIVHAQLSKGPGCVLMASDTQPGTPFTQGTNCYINITCESEQEIDSLFEALASGGKVEMPVQDTFWGARFGMLTDKFGVHWMFNYEKPKKS